MIDLNGIARHLRLPVDQIRLAADLLDQGYSPKFIERYRADESNSLSSEVLRRLKSEIDRRKRLEFAKDRALSHLPKGSVLDVEAQRALDEARTTVAIDIALRCFRARRTLEQSQERDGTAGKLLESMLSYTGQTPEDLGVWVAQQLSGESVDPEQVLSQAKRLIASLMHCDTTLNNKLRQAIERNATLRVEEAATTATEESATIESSTGNHSSEDVAASVHGDSMDENESHDMDAEHGELCASESDAAIHDDQNVERQESTEPGTDTLVGFSPPEYPKAASSEAIHSLKRTVTLQPLAKMTPRQRRRRWLTSVIAPMRSIKKPLSKLTAYQVLMLGRGTRSQLIATPLDYDHKILVDLARNSFVEAKHPFADWLRQVVADALEHGVRAKAESDAMSELEERAAEHLLEHAADDLKRQLMRRPVRGHTIALIDSVGPVAVTVAIVDPAGQVLACEELPCSAHPDVVGQNVVKLGEWVHRHKVTLVAITNGPARRFMVVTLREFMLQSKDSGIRWTMADRSGAEAYAVGRVGLKELSAFNRRERAAIWAARCLQDPLVELLKVDINRLRLGSFQRELPQEPLKRLVEETISECVCERGIDTQNASERELQYIPGVRAEQAKQIHQMAQSGTLMSRNQLLFDVSDWPELDRRHAIAWLRVFGSENALDATLVHPEDYHLARRVIQGTEIQQPLSSPPGWVKRKLLATAPAPTIVDGPTGSLTSDLGAVQSSESHPPVSDESIEASPALPEEQTSTSIVSDGASDSLDQTESSSVSESTESVATPEPTGSIAAHVAPEYPEQIADTPTRTIPIDCEKLANQWQVGRAKLKAVADSLFDPFGDPRLSGVPVPMYEQLPSLESLEPENCVWAVVVGVADFGVFVELGPNCNGLIHISRLSANFIEDPHQCVQIGDLIMAWVVEIDHKKNRVGLTALSPAQRERLRAEDESRRARQAEERQNRGQRAGHQHADRNPQYASRQGQSDRVDAPDQRKGTYQSGNTDSAQVGRSRPYRQANSDSSRGEASGGQDRQQSRRRFASKPGQAGRSGGRGDRNRGNDSKSNEGKSFVLASKQPRTPISQAMKEGEEPLRSFSDLMQFYEAKRTDTPAPSVPEPSQVKQSIDPSEASEMVDSVEANEPKVPQVSAE